MAVLALSVVGAGISSAAGLGASIGWMVGSLVGNLLFQKKGPNTQGPRLTDLTVQSSTEGAPIPIVYGRMRIAGNMIWSSGIRETKTKKKQGGKGMGGSSTHTTYSYDATFAIGLCEGPIQGIRRIWADGKLIYSNAANATAATLYASKKKMANITVYLGNETQTADPIIAANVGAANCPAFRGLAYVVFDRFQLADFGNRIPNLTFEVVTGTKGAYLWRVNTWPFNWSSFLGFEFANGTIIRSSDSYISGNNWRNRTRTYDLNGNLLSDVTGPVFQLWNGSGTGIDRIKGRVRLGRAYSGASGVVPGMFRWLYDGNITAPEVSMGTYGDNPSPMGQGAAGIVYYNNYVYTTLEALDKDNPRRAANGIARFSVERGVAISRVPDKYVNISTDAGGLGLATPRGPTSSVVRSINISDEGTVIATIHPENIITYRIVEFDTSLNFIKGYTFAGPEIIPDTVNIVRNGRFWVAAESGGGGTTRIRLYEEQSPGVLTFIKNLSVGTQVEAVHSLGNGLLYTMTGVFQIYPPITPPALTVGSIVSDICRRSGLDPGDIDTAALTQTVDGYVISQPMTGRSAIEPLAQAFFFDGVESDFILKFVKRPGTIVATLEEGDLGAGIERPAQEDFKCVRMQELELPVEVRVQYVDVNNDFLPGLQRFRRLTTLSKDSLDLQFTIAMSSTYAAQVADITMRNLWAERTSYEFSLTREFLQLDPCDLVNMPNGDTIRITQAEFTDPGLVRISGLRDITGGYTSNAVGNSTTHEYPQEVPIIGPTTLVLLDISPLRDLDAIVPGYYVAMYGPLAGWRGAELVRSVDDGSTYNEIDIVTAEATVGYATTVLGTPQDWNLFDLSAGVTVQLVTPGATLSSISDTALLAGGNVILVGSEIIQFGEATLVGTGLYRLSRLMRGRLGTEAHISSHVVGERCVLLDSNIRYMEDSQANIDVEMVYKAIAFGSTQDEVDSETFTHTGNIMRNPAPVQVHSGLNTAGAWVIEWTRRNRANYWWATSGLSPINDAAESYRLRFYDLNGVLKGEVTSSTATYTYSRALQITHFGHPVLSYEVRIAQISDLGIVGHEASHFPEPAGRGRYSSLHRLLNPVMYWRNIFDGTPDDDSGNNYDGTSVATVSFNSTDLPIVGDPSTSTFKSAGVTTGYFQRAISTSPLLAITWAHMSLSIWVKFTNTDTVRTIAGIWDGSTTAQQSYRIGIGSVAGSLRFQVMTANGIRSAQHNGSYNDGQWHHVVGVYDHGVTMIYVDGVLKTSSSGTDQLLNAGGSANFRVGRNHNDTEQYSGQFFEVAVHERALSAAIIANMYATARGLP